MAVEGTPYSHVYIRWHSESLDKTLIYQASGTSVNFMSLDRFLSHNIIVDEFEFDLSDETYKNVLRFAIDTVGAKYGAKQLMGLGVVRLGSVFGAKWHNPFRDKRQTYVCSELAAYIIKEYMAGSISVDLDEISPKDVYGYLSTIKNPVN